MHLPSVAAAAAAKSLQSCPTLCDPIDGSPPGSSIPGILQARILEWVAISFSNACMHAKSLQSCPTLCDLTDSNPPGSPVPGILQATTLEWVAISFSNACMHAKLLQLCLTVRPYGQQPTHEAIYYLPTPNFQSSLSLHFHLATTSLFFMSMIPFRFCR